MLCTALAAMLVAFPAASNAAPPLTIPQVQAKLDQLNNQAEIAAERSNAEQQKMAATKQQLAALRADVARQQKSVSALRVQIGQFAAAQYRAGGIDTTVQLLLSDSPRTFVSQLASVQAFTGSQADLLTQLKTQDKLLAERQHAERAEFARYQAAAKRSAADLADANAKVKQTKELLARLTEQQRRALEAARRAREEAAQRAAAAAERQREREAAARQVVRDRASRNRPAQHQNTPTRVVAAPQPAPRPAPPAPVSSGSQQAKARIAVAYAYAQLGKPYAFGAAGPNAFDCSGLTMMAWRAAGVYLPHGTLGQYAAVGHKVSRSQLQPGDLVFFYATMHHVGIYIGNGMVIHAPHTGTVVKIAPMSWMPFAGAVRPGG